MSKQEILFYRKKFREIKSIVKRWFHEIFVKETLDEIGDQMKFKSGNITDVDLEAHDVNIADENPDPDDDLEMSIDEMSDDGRFLIEIGKEKDRSIGLLRHSTAFRGVLPFK